MGEKQFEDVDEFSLMDILDIFLNNKKIFFISVFICLFIAFVFLFFKTPTYTKTASLLVNNEAQGQSIGNKVSNSLNDLNLFKLNTNIENEIGSINTPFYMNKVVEKLHLNYIYMVERVLFKWEDLYGCNPFKVTLDKNLQKYPVSFKFRFNSITGLEVLDLKVDCKECNATKDLNLENVFVTPYGNISFTKTPFFNIHNINNLNFRFLYSTVHSTSRSFLASLTVNRKDKKGTIINLTFKNNNAQRAEDVLNTLMDVYNVNIIAENKSLVNNTAHFIDKRLAIIEKELGEIDNNIAEYKSVNVLPDIDAINQNNLQESLRNNLNKTDLKNHLSIVLSIQNYLKRNVNINELISVETGMNDVSINSRVKEYNDLLLEKKRLLLNSSENNPLIETMTKNLIIIREGLVACVDNLVNNLILQIKNNEIEAKVNTEKLKRSPKQTEALATLQRQQKIKEEMYIFLLQKRESNELSLASLPYKTRILTYAEGSSTDTKKSLVIIIAFILGLGFPMAYFYAEILLTTKIHSIDELKEIDTYILGILPFQKDIISKSLVNSLVNNTINDEMGESFRVLRSNLDFFITNKTSGNVIQTISIHPGSGKSFFTFNMALCMIAKGAKVLIIDADMRRATLSKRYFKEPEFGMSDYLNGNNKQLEDLIIRDESYKNLDVLPVGHIPCNPSELLLSPDFKKIISRCKDNYDYIFIDSTIIDVIPDTAIISEVCDINIFIVRAGLTDKRLLPKIREICSQGRYKNMCLLLNGVNRKKRNRGAYEYYAKYYNDEGDNVKVKKVVKGITNIYKSRWIQKIK